MPRQDRKREHELSNGSTNLLLTSKAHVGLTLIRLSLLHRQKTQLLRISMFQIDLDTPQNPTNPIRTPPSRLCSPYCLSQSQHLRSPALHNIHLESPTRGPLVLRMLPQPPIPRLLPDLASRKRNKNPEGTLSELATPGTGAPPTFTMDLAALSLSIKVMPRPASPAQSFIISA